MADSVKNQVNDNPEIASQGNLENFLVPAVIDEKVEMHHIASWLSASGITSSAFALSLFYWIWLSLR
ncbi:hypothetical protein SC171_21315 [Pantoea cypripedii]|uniref:hypothetical protein n=1 Tax=Pantoea cypripedii TaxID=55209 RepID=UPI002FCA2463